MSEKNENHKSRIGGQALIEGIMMSGVKKGAMACRLPNGDEVNFYHLIPIYKKEMDFKRMYGAEALITYALSDVSHIVDVKRPALTGKRATT